MKETRQSDFSNNTVDWSSFMIPSADELERDLVSLLLFHHDEMENVYGELTPSDFRDKAARTVYEAMRDKYEQKKTWNLLTIAAMVDSELCHSALYHISESGAQYRVSKEMIYTLKQQSLGRRIFEKLYHLIEENGKTPDRSIIISKALNFFSKMSQRLSSQGESKKDMLVKHKELMNRRYSGEIMGIPTGLTDLDVLLGQGLQKRDLVIVGARPSVGKTSFSLSIAHNAARKGFKVLFISLEMDDEEIMDRLLSFEINAPVTSIIRGKVKKETVSAGYKKLLALPLTINYLAKGTSADVYSIASKHKSREGLDLLVVDYLGFLDDKTEKDGSEVQRIGRITRNLKIAAQMLDCALLTPHQLNRKIEQRSKKDQESPLLSDLRDSGHIEQDADVVMFLNRDVVGEAGEHATLRIGKHRTGQTGKLDLRFNSLTTKFENV